MEEIKHNFKIGDKVVNTSPYYNDPYIIASISEYYVQTVNGTDDEITHHISSIRHYEEEYSLTF